MFGDGWRVLPVMLLAVLHATPAMPVPTTTPTKSAAQRLDATRARRVAEEAFLENTARKVKTYSVKEEGLVGAYWEFFIQGTGKFARPGYHWWVKVNAESGKATVIAGE